MVEAGVPLSFTGDGRDPEGGALTLAWDFGDGETAAGASPPAHSFTAPGTFLVTLNVTDGAGLSAAASRTVTVTAPASLHLSGDRVLVEVVWRNPYSGEGGVAFPLPENDQFGYFYYSDPDNPEVFVKVLDFGSGTALCFVGGLTDFYYKVTFMVAQTGQKLVFEKPPYQYIGFVDATTLKYAGAPGAPAGFLTGGGGMTFVGALSTGQTSSSFQKTPAQAPQALAAAPQSLALSSGRVSVIVDWRNPYSGETGRAYGIPKADPFGFFYYTDRDNPEVFVKVLDFGDGIARVFVGGLTDFYYKVTFRVLQSGQTLVFEKPPYQYIGFADNGTLKF
jgi:PKD repeat protein